MGWMATASEHAILHTCTHTESWAPPSRVAGRTCTVGH